ALRCRPFHEIRLTTDFNAAVYQIPRLGFLGWPRTHLEVGLPLALALGPGELRAVLVHECAHLSARHGRQAGRLYLLHQTWGNLIRAMQRPAGGRLDRVGRSALATFLARHSPRLHPRAPVPARAHECRAGFPSAPPVCAAEVFLGERLADLASELSEQWRTSVLAAWRARHRRALAEAKAGAATESEAADVAVLWEAARELANRDGLGP